ncbi:MAG: acyl-CoA thioesterase [Ignavibacteria bacterium]|nr:acyl-CoA thioesterase [Ignavibacteria bacterium]
MNNQIVHSIFIRIPYADVDKMGIVYNGNYLRYFEQGRTELMRNFGLPYSEVESRGYILPLVEAHINWKGSARYDDLIEIQTSFDPRSVNSKIRFDYHLFSNEREIATGFTVHTFVRADKFVPVRPPKFFLEWIKENC